MSKQTSYGKGSTYRKVDRKKWDSSPLWEELEKKKKEEQSKPKSK